MQTIDIPIRELDNGKLLFDFSDYESLMDEEINKIIKNEPAYDIPVTEFVQTRKHKKKRINKKWLKKYGVKSTCKMEKGWIIKHNADGTSEFIK